MRVEVSVNVMVIDQASIKGQRVGRGSRLGASLGSSGLRSLLGVERNGRNYYVVARLHK